MRATSGTVLPVNTPYSQRFSYMGTSQKHRGCHGRAEVGTCFVGGQILHGGTALADLDTTHLPSTAKVTEVPACAMHLGLSWHNRKLPQVF